MHTPLLIFGYGYVIIDMEYRDMTRKRYLFFDAGATVQRKRRQYATLSFAMLHYLQMSMELFCIFAIVKNTFTH